MKFWIYLGGEGNAYFLIEMRQILKIRIQITHWNVNASNGVNFNKQ